MALKTKVTTKTHVQLTAPGNAEIVTIGNIQPASAAYEVTVATIDTSVAVRMDYSDDGFSTSVVGETNTIVADGVFVFPAVTRYRQMRPVFAAEVGGTAATVDIETTTAY